MVSAFKKGIIKNNKSMRVIRFAMIFFIVIGFISVCNTLIYTKHQAAGKSESNINLTKGSPPQAETLIDNAINKNDDRIHKQLQFSHFTGMNRYPDEYAFVKKFVDDNMSSKTNKKILSFGASTGLEVISLATLYYNDIAYSDSIDIYGVDLDEKTLNKARQNVAEHDPPILEPKITFFNGRDKAIEAYGDYDVIFANSVLCLHENGAQLDQITDHFPFKDFEAAIATLDASLNEGGLFAMVNSNYNFKETATAKRYKAVAKCTGNFVPRVDQENNILVENEGNIALDCVWMKEHTDNLTKGSPPQEETPN
eukprot:CAMPEP_0198279968 /NCGR_PEP_ID=MMETSP1449-20131203/153_1 /TAXON_ID=420275 /ORGANISM="Attheya septentrionalis, Strain CCMP2084" /LENGTH=310 /DNA_ID=CAMNT_0043975219 /DNA_START=74 /DNA_END=1006 /DNA_ORIENTATION=+